MDREFKLELNATSAAAMKKIGSSIGKNLKGGEVVELVSDLGGGKTTLIQGIATGAGSRDIVTSPSFTIRNDYQTKDQAIAHFDFYRLNDPGILREMVAEAVMDRDITVLIEWGGVVDDVLPADRVVIEIKTTSETSRRLIVTAPMHLKYLFEGSLTQQ